MKTTSPTSQIDRAEIRRMAAERGLTEMETEVSMKFLCGEPMAAPLNYFPKAVCFFVGEMRERQTDRRENLIR